MSFVDQHIDEKCLVIGYVPLPCSSLLQAKSVYFSIRMPWQEFRSHIRHLPAGELARIERAFELGKRVHGEQKRKSGEPYFNHPIAVAHMLADMGADADTLIAALLHDTVEDTPLTIADIDKEFGGSVAMLIEGLTKLSSDDVAMSPKLDENIETLRKIFTLMQQDVRIMVIKLVDRLHNMQTIEFLKPERQKTLSQETLEVFVKIADKLCMLDLRDELEALCLATLEPDTLPILQRIRVLNEERGAELISMMEQRLKAHDKSLMSKIHPGFEYKTWDQLKAQMSVGESVATGLSSTTLSFICPDIDACYRVLGALHQLWKREILSFQDFINAPQLNGYQGLHTTVIIPGGLRVRCKIRTPDMQKYAHLGIATKCFDGKASGLPDYLPWTQRISPLTADTEGSSNNFWESLKSDILGESIVIHGPDDSTIQVPRNATALDGAFYLFRDRALTTQTIKVNGVAVSLDTELQNAASIDVVLSDTQTCSREWLKKVHTGLAAATIRIALGKESQAEKTKIGKEMLQEVFTQNRKGFIEEFDERTLKANLQSFGFPSLADMYSAIAEGRLEPQDAFRALFEKPNTKKDSRLPKTIIRYVMHSDNAEAMERVNLIHRSYSQLWDDIEYRRRQKGMSSVTLRVRMDSQTAAGLGQALRNAGAENVVVKPVPTPWHLMIIALLIGLWGLDPVLSKVFMMKGMDPFTLSFTRAWSVLFFAALVILASGRGQRSLVRIPFSYPSLWVAGFAVFMVNIFTYLFLTDGSPVLYNTIVRVNAVILALPLITKPRFTHTMLLSVLLAVIGLVMLFVGPFDFTDLLLSTAYVASFSVYTIATIQFQSVAKIHARYVQLYATTSFIAAIASLSLPLLGLVHLPENGMLLLLAAFYAMLFVGPPYIIFHAFTDNFGYATLSPWINATILVTLIAQPLILHDTFAFAILIPAAILLTAASLIASRVRNLAH